jgi:DNA polymerase-3 subunit gamma/tau
MPYQVTARKWRPQTFDDVVEQRHVTRTLKNAIQLGRVAHAYLFAGTRGVGKTTMARVLAKALNCDQGPTPQPCGTCGSCRDITQGASMDIMEIDGASNRGIDEIRDLRETLRYLPSRGRYKVYIIDEVHMLTKEAFNALLKTLEEPPPHVVFIFATTELDKIPYTIVSRCQRFEFKRVSLAGIVSQLKCIAQSEGIAISHTSLMRVAKAAEGSMRDAQSLLDQVVAYAGLEVDDDEVSHLLGSVGSETLAQCLRALLQQDVETALRTVDDLLDQGHEAMSMIRALQEGLRHLIVFKTTEKPETLIPLSEGDLEVLRPVADLASVEALYGHVQVLLQAEQSLRVSSNPFLVLEMALVRMSRIGCIQSLETILETLQHLEGGLPATSLAAGPVVESASANLPTPSLPVSPESSATDLSPSPETQITAVPEAPPAPEPAPEKKTPDDFWAALQDFLAEQRPSVAAFLQPGEVLLHNEEKLVVGFARAHSFNRSALLESENLAAVREAVESVGGRPLRVEIVSLEASTDDSPATMTSSVKTAQERSAVSDMQRQKRQAIQAVLDIFDGTIVT